MGGFKENTSFCGMRQNCVSACRRGRKVSFRVLGAEKRQHPILLTEEDFKKQVTLEMD